MPNYINVVLYRFAIVLSVILQLSSPASASEEIGWWAAENHSGEISPCQSAPETFEKFHDRIIDRLGSRGVNCGSYEPLFPGNASQRCKKAIKEGFLEKKRLFCVNPNTLASIMVGWWKTKKKCQSGRDKIETEKFQLPSSCSNKEEDDKYDRFEEYSWDFVAGKCMDLISAVGYLVEYNCTAELSVDESAVSLRCKNKFKGKPKKLYGSKAACQKAQ